MLGEMDEGLRMVHVDNDACHHGRRPRRQIDGVVDASMAKEEIGADLWLGYRYEEIAALDERTDARLRDVLDSAEFAALPVRKSEKRPTKPTVDSTKGKSGGGR